MLTIRLDSTVPLAEQVATGLRLAIAGGQLGPGDPLPTVRQLAGDLGIDLNTIARAYRALQSEGLVSSVRGRGTTVVARRGNARASDPEVRAELAHRARVLASDARLAGMDRQATSEMLEQELDLLWTEE